MVTHDTWFPIGFPLPGGVACGPCIASGADWQILETSDQGKALITGVDLAARWISSGLVGEDLLPLIEFGARRYRGLSCGPSHVLAAVADCPSPNTKAEALAFAMAFKATRAVDRETPLQDAIYVERISRLLPTYDISARTDDDLVVGYWLTGGATVSTNSFRRLHQTLSWLSSDDLKDVIATAGFETRGAEQATPEAASGESPDPASAAAGLTTGRPFDLPGRPELASFINEHIVDIIQNRERYRALGIGFPRAVVLYGPPGCGKIFAVERLIEFLGWPSYSIDAASVASPYIHETSKKVSAVFDEAKKNAPSVLVIDEMEAFLADRETGSGHHRVEEVAEFLRRIPEAAKNEVLVIAMTNRIEMIDPAILRRGRFDHLVKVSYANEEEIRSLLSVLLSSLPKDTSVDSAPLARALAGRPLSDVTFVVREGARRAARSGKTQLSQADLLAALEVAPAIDPDAGKRNKIGFV